MIADQKEPISAPCDVAVNRAVAGNFDRDFRLFAVARNVYDGHFPGLVQSCRDEAHGRLDAMVADFNFPKIGKRNNEADGAMNAHPEVADVVKEDDARRIGGVDRLAEHRADDNVGATGFIHRGTAEMIVLAAKDLQALGHRTGIEVRTTAYDDASRFTAGVRINHMDALSFIEHR